MFTVEERDRVRSRLLEMARADARIVAGAEIGALAQGGDRWSDLDLTFGLAGGASVDAVLADWTPELVREFDAAHLFDLPYLTTVYRVFLLPGNLQALALASLRHGFPVSYARGFDQLPTETLALASASLVGSLERDELLRALDAAVELLLNEADEVRELASNLAEQLRELTAA